MNPGAALLDLLFPRKCPFCQRLVEGDALLCPDCQRTLPWLTEKAAERSPEFLKLCVSPLRYKGPVAESIHRYKFSGRRNYAAAYGALMAQCVLDHPDVTFDLLSWAPAGKDPGHPRPVRPFRAGRPPGQRSGRLRAAARRPSGGQQHPAGRRCDHLRRHPVGVRPGAADRRRGPGLCRHPGTGRTVPLRSAEKPGIFRLKSRAIADIINRSDLSYQNFLQGGSMI